MIFDALIKIFKKAIGYSLTWGFLFTLFGGFALWDEGAGLYFFILFAITVGSFLYSLVEIDEEFKKVYEMGNSQKIFEIEKQCQLKLQELKDYHEKYLSKSNKLIEDILHEKNEIKKEKIQVDELQNKISSSKKSEIESLNNRIKELEEQDVFDGYKLHKIIKESNKIKEERDIYKTSLVEKNKFFPTLINLIEEFDLKNDEGVVNYLIHKKNPSKKGSEIVQEQTKLRRAAEKDFKKSKLLIEYYESIAPFLLELKEDLAIPDEDILEDYTEEEQRDFVTKYLSKEEYRKIPSVERNQMALDRFWKRPNKSNWLIGLLYERYVGYLYESKGYDVKYHGASEGKQDLGRDLICEKGNEILIVQCKHWSQFKTIHEKHIFQLFGTTFQYKYQLEKVNEDKKIKAIFYTSTRLSDIAREFAKELEIDVKEGAKLDKNYPCIKCNIGRTSEEKIYHLPFDQQYDKILIEPKRREFYCSTVKEAEDAGFRRAFRYKKIKKAV